jgi:hypothetical protein
LGGYGSPQPLLAGGMLGSGVGLAATGVGVGGGVVDEAGVPEPQDARSGSKESRSAPPVTAGLRRDLLNSFAVLNAFISSPETRNVLMCPRGLSSETALPHWEGGITSQPSTIKQGRFADNATPATLATVFKCSRGYRA